MVVERTPQGTYRARYRVNGRQRSKTFKRKVDAERHERTVLSERDRGVYFDRERGRISLADWADLWLDSARHIGASTRDLYRVELDRHILADLGDLRLDQVTPDRLDEFLTARHDLLAPSTVHRLYRTLNTMLAAAVARGRLPVNPCKLVKPPMVPPAEMRFLTAAEVGRLADEITPERYRAWVLLAAFCGLRWGEAMGLRPEDIDLDAGRISVVRQRIESRSAREFVETEPKMKSKRSFIMPTLVVIALDEHLRTYPGERVFLTANGNTPLRSSFSKHFKAALERAGIDRSVRIHDLRHTSVALAIQAGGHPKAIQARHGHANITITLDRYGHLFPDIDSDIAASLDKIWSNR